MSNQVTTMNKPIAFNRKVEILRDYEAYAYRIVHYLLENETLAAEAAMAALLEVGGRDKFFNLPSSSQLSVLKQTAITQALAVKQQSRTAG